MKVQRQFNIYLLATILIQLSFASVVKVQAADPPSAVGSMLTLLKSGRVPEARLGTIVKLICDRGNEHDLRYVYDQILKKEWSSELRLSALQQLSAASTTRNTIPAGDLSGLPDLFEAENPKLVKTALLLAGQWKVESAFAALQKTVSTPGTSADVRALALESMASISPENTKSLLVKLAQQKGAFADRSLAINVLAKSNIDQAAKLAATALAEAAERDDPTTLLNGFLEQENGSKVLSESLVEASIRPDTAKLALRHMYSIGRADPELSAALMKIAGIDGDPKVPTPEELKALVNEVAEQGDAARGEMIFRRNDLSCMKCHAVSKAGGQIGPDLSAIGASSPGEYVVMSVLDPDQAIKEAYTTRVVITMQGRIHQGLVGDRTANALVLKDATGKETSIPIEDIDDEVEGKSLMPKGLVKFMTHAEFVDLAKFLTMLGKPGEYAVRSTQRMQRWRLLKDVPQGLIEEVPTLSSFEDLVLRATLWEAIYSKVNGELPLSELTEKTSQSVVYVQGELNVTHTGAIAGTVNSAEGLTLWIDDEMVETDGDFDVELEEGVHPVTFRIDTNQRSEETLKLVFTKPTGSNAEFAVVDGQ
ncbi:c-type cytochrome [bacterium]|nr:c-type cytochrome [bacterium]